MLIGVRLGILLVMKCCKKPILHTAYTTRWNTAQTTEATRGHTVRVPCQDIWIGEARENRKTTFPLSLPGSLPRTAAGRSRVFLPRCQFVDPSSKDWSSCRGPNFLMRDFGTQS